MGIPVYTRLCQVENEQDRQWLEEVVRQFEERTNHLPNFQLPGFEPLGNGYYKKRYGRRRLVARLESIQQGEGTFPVLVLLDLVHRNDPRYYGGDAQRLHQYHRSRIAQALPDIERELQRTDETPPPVQPLPPLPQELHHLLHLPEVSHKEGSVFLSPLWIEAIGKLRTDGERNAVYEALLEIVYDYSQVHMLLERRAGPSVIYYTMVRDPESPIGDQELCHCFLLGLTCDQWPQEEQDEFRRRCQELFEDLQSDVFELQGSDNVETFNDQMSRRSASACPAYLLADQACWSEVQKERETFLALSSQELTVLRRLLQQGKTPCVIEGRAGSGKSTLLAYYAARRICPQQELPHNDRQLQLLYLSENRTLVENANKLINRLVQHRLDVTTSHRDTPGARRPLLMQPTFQSFHKFALEQLPPERRGRFAVRSISDRWIGFERFRDMLCNLRHPAVRQLSAEVAWFAIRSYIKGFNIHAQEEEERWLSPEEYVNEVPRRDRQISVELYEQIWNHVWPWYKEQTVTGSQDEDVPPYWDDLDLAWEVLRFRRKDAPRYAVMLCDEVQDFSRVEMAAVLGALEWLQYDLSPLSRDQLRLPVVLAGDAHQTINPTCFRWARVRGDAARALVQHLPEVDVPRVESEPLTYNYRNAHAIALLCNAIQLLRQETLGMDDALQVPWQIADPFPNQRVRRLLIDQTNQHLVQDLYNRSVWLIAPEPADPQIESCRDFWQGLGFTLEQRLQNVDTPATVKGLEQRFVAVIGFGELFAQMGVHDFWQWSNAMENEAIPEQKRFAVEFFLNRLYVAISRAQKQLWIIDTERGWKQFWEPFLQWLRPRSSNKLANFYYSDGTLEELVNIDRERWEVLAKESAKLAQEQESAKHAERAAFYYQLVGDTFHAREMEAYHLRYQGKLVEGAEVLQELGNQEKAARWFWEARAWDKLADCAVPPQWRTDLAGLLSRSLKTRDESWVHDVDQHLHHPQVAEQMESRGDARIWASILLEYARTIAQLAERLPEDLVLRAYNLLQRYSWLQTSLPDDPRGRHWAAVSAVLAHRLQKWPEAVQFWEQAGQTQHLNYFQAKARSTAYPESLRWWESAKDWDRIVELYETHRDSTPLNREDRLRVARAYESRQQWEQALFILCNTSPRRTVLLWRQMLEHPERISSEPWKLVQQMHRAYGRLDSIDAIRNWSDLLFDLMRETQRWAEDRQPWFEALVMGMGKGCAPDALAHRFEVNKRDAEEYQSNDWLDSAHLLCRIAACVKGLVPKLVHEGKWEEAYRLAWLVMRLLWRFERRSPNELEQRRSAARVVPHWRSYVELKDDLGVVFPLAQVDPLVRPAVQDVLACIANGPEDWLRKADFDMLQFVRDVADMADGVAENFYENLELCIRTVVRKEDAGPSTWWLLVARFAEQVPLRIRAVQIYESLRKLAELLAWDERDLQEIKSRLESYQRKYASWKGGGREERPVIVQPGRDGRSDHLLVSCIAEKSAVIEFLADRAQVRFLVPAEKAAEPRLRFHDDEVSVVGPEWIEPEFRWMIQHPQQVVRLFWHPDKRRLSVVADRRFVVDFPPAARTE